MSESAIRQGPWSLGNHLEDGLRTASPAPLSLHSIVHASTADHADYTACFGVHERSTGRSCRWKNRGENMWKDA